MTPSELEKELGRIEERVGKGDGAITLTTKQDPILGTVIQENVLDVLEQIITRHQGQSGSEDSRALIAEIRRLQGEVREAKAHDKAMEDMYTGAFNELNIVKGALSLAEHERDKYHGHLEGSTRNRRRVMEERDHLQAENARLQERVRELEGDRERLDWLESKKGAWKGFNVEVIDNSIFDGGVIAQTGNGLDPNFVDGLEYHATTLREAIDAARQSEGEDLK